MKQHWTGSAVYRSFASIALAVLTLSTGLLGGCAVTVPPCAQPDLAYVGTNGSQIRALRLDACVGTVTMIGPVADVAKPRWSVAHPTLPVVYTAIENEAKEGAVVAYAVEHRSGALTPVNEVATGGSGTTHLWLDVPSMTLLTANLGGGSTSSIAVNRDGSLGPRVTMVKTAGSGPHRRQTGSHPHASVVDPSGRYVLVPDLGADRVFVYGLDRTIHALVADASADARAFIAPPGSGPRHLVFGSSGRFVYLLSELSAELLTLQWDAQAGRLTQVQILAVSSPEFQGVKSASEIALSRDGRFVYVGNRGDNTLVVYRVNADSGLLTLVQRVPSGGEAPWAFELHPSGKWMLVANNRSNRVNLFAIDPASGMLSDTRQSVESPAPVSIAFVN